MFSRIKDHYYSVKNWFKHCFNKHHFKTVWKTFISYPWDYSYNNDILRCRLVEQYEYFKKSEIAERNDYTASRIKLAINLYDIMNDDVTAGYLLPKSIKDFLIGEHNYVATKYVNVKNAERFVPKEILEIYTKYPTFLYEEKAHNLFWKVIMNYSRDWWD